MAAGARAHDADALPIDVPFVRLGTGEPHGAGGVVEHRRMAVALRAEPVFQDEPGDAVVRQPFGVAGAFVGREAAVTATRADDDGRAGRLVRRGQEGGERRLVVVLVPERARGAIRPEQNGIERGGVERERGGEGEEESGDAHEGEPGRPLRPSPGRRRARDTRG